MGFLLDLFRRDFLPHGWCYRWDPEIVWLHVSSDLLICLAYYFIPFSLMHIVRRRKDMVYPSMFWLFGTFILACGTTHLMSVLVVWKPWYSLDGVVKLITALVSVPTAIVLLRLAPSIIALPSPENLRLLNEQLAQEVADRRAAEEEVRRLNADLEQRVQERTRELHESENRLRAILDSTPLLVFMKDREGRLMFVNREFEKTFELKLEDMVGQKNGVLLSEDLAGLYAAADEDVWRDKQPVHVEEHAFHRGANHTYMVVKFPIYDQGDRPYALCGMAADITERKQAEQNLRRYNEDLQQFAFVAAHDLQEPLRTVKNYAQFLVRRYKGNLGREADEFIEYITTGVDRMYELIAGLQSYSELDRAYEPLRTVDSAFVVKETLRGMETTLRETGTTVEVGDLPAVRAHPAQLGQVFQNLVSNAIKYHSAAPALIRITAARLGRQWEFSVKDNGIGLDMQYAEQIFGVFRRLHGRHIPGTGIGLAIVKKIVESHGGKVRVVSSPGKGADFRFTLPAA